MSYRSKMPLPLSDRYRDPRVATAARPNRFEGRVRLARHRHALPYTALVLEGGYIEAGEQGRIRVEAGHVVHHQSNGAHLNDFDGVGAVVLDLPLLNPGLRGVGVVEDVDAIARLAERDARDASNLLFEQFRPIRSTLGDWPDLLAEALAAPTFIGVLAWAERASLAPQSVSRGFRRAYGVTPKRYRAERRALAAIERLERWHGSLAHLAAACGFADQAHMTRTIRAVTGVPPSELRVQSVQA